MSDNETEAPEVLVATKTGVTTLNGRRVKIRAGVTTVEAGHPLHVGRESMFAPLTVQHRGVEQATNAPGESRDVVRPEKADLLAEAERLGVEVNPRSKVATIQRQIDEARAAAEAADDTGDTDGTETDD